MPVGLPDISEEPVDQQPSTMTGTSKCSTSTATDYDVSMIDTEEDARSAWDSSIADIRIQPHELLKEANQMSERRPHFLNRKTLWCDFWSNLKIRLERQSQAEIVSWKHFEDLTEASKPRPNPDSPFWIMLRHLISRDRKEHDDLLVLNRDLDDATVSLHGTSEQHIVKVEHNLLLIQAGRLTPSDFAMLLVLWKEILQSEGKDCKFM